MGEITPQHNEKMLHQYVNDGVPLPLGLTTQENSREFTINGLDSSHPAYGFEHSLEIGSFDLFEEVYRGGVSITTEQDRDNGWSRADIIDFAVDCSSCGDRAIGSLRYFPVSVTPEEVIADAFQQKVAETEAEIIQNENEVQRGSGLSKFANRMSIALGLASVGLFAAEIATDSPVEPQFTRIELLASLSAGSAVILWGLWFALKIEKDISQDKIAHARIAKDSFQAELDAVLTNGVTFLNNEDEETADNDNLTEEI